jgi:hypothetical protein
MGEASVGRALAVAALAPIAEHEADLREREEEVAERRRQREEALAAAPALVPPAPPRPWIPSWHIPRHERQEVLLGWVVVGIPSLFGIAFVSMIVGMLLFGGGSAATGVLTLLGPAAVVAYLVGKTARAELRKREQAEESKEAYDRELREFEARQIERAAIEKEFEEVAP